MPTWTMFLSDLTSTVFRGYHEKVIQSQNSHGPYAKERRYRRFDLQFPVSLRYPEAGSVRELEAISQNVSVGGLLVTASDEVPLRTPVNLSMNVLGPRFRHPVTLLGAGEVVRVESLGPGAGFAIAVECKQPIQEMEEHFPA